MASNTLRFSSVCRSAMSSRPLQSRRSAAALAPGAVGRSRKALVAPVRAMDVSVFAEVANLPESAGSASTLGLAVTPLETLCTSFALGAKDNLNSLWNQFEFYCNTAPLATTVTSGAILYGAGNFVSQLLAHARGEDLDFEVDLETLGLFFAWGALDGVLGHEFYSNLDVLTSTYLPQLDGMALISTKVATEELIYSPIWYVIFFAYMELLGGRTWADAVKRIKVDMIPVMKLNAKMWVPLGFINFALIPLNVRVPIVFCEAFVFSILLSIFEAEGAGHHGAPEKKKVASGSAAGKKDELVSSEV